MKEDKKFSKLENRDQKKKWGGGELRTKNMQCSMPMSASLLAPQSYDNFNSKGNEERDKRHKKYKLLLEGKEYKG